MPKLLFLQLLKTIRRTPFVFAKGEPTPVKGVAFSQKMTKGVRSVVLLYCKNKIPRKNGG